MSVAEFRRLGYLAFLNRHVLHPLGMALEVIVEEDGTERFGEVWDSREDPAGYVYAKLDDDHVKTQRTLDLAWDEIRARRSLFHGWVVQPPECVALDDGGARSVEGI